MSSHQPERCIPHIRDIFSDYRTSNDYNEHLFSKFSTIRLGEKEDEEGSKECSDEEHYEYRGYSSDEASKSSSCSTREENDPRNNKTRNKQETEKQPPTKQNFNNYRTLTEKDLRHIERHLSMKKTIRKQLSRHLSQACVENMDPYGDNGGKVILADRRQNDRISYNVMTLSKSSKSAKSEPNFMDMLKTVKNDEGDSGHSSPTRETENRLRGKSRRGTTESWDHDVYVQDPPTQQNTTSNPEASKKRSLWQKLTKRNKNGR